MIIRVAVRTAETASVSTRIAEIIAAVRRRAEPRRPANDGKTEARPR